jgi:hypothetical protein
MGATANLSKAGEVVGFGLDSVVIVNYVGGIPGGRTLDVADFAPETIKAGHLVIRSTVDDTVYKPMPVTSGGDAYASLPSNFEYVGVVVCSVSKEAPFVGIMNDGTFNDVAAPYPLTAEIKAALKEAVPTLIPYHA